MKKYIAILILILFCQAGYSQSMDKLFNDFAKQKNVTHVTVGPFLMKISSLFTETMGVKSIEVLSRNAAIPSKTISALPSRN